jgi:hypothetical protein
VTWQYVGQDDGKGPPATAAPPAIGTIHPLATKRLTARPQGIVANGTAVPVQTANAAAMRTWRLLEEKAAISTPGHRAQNEKADGTSPLLPESKMVRRAFFDGTVQRRNSVQKDFGKRRDGADGTSTTLGS